MARTSRLLSLSLAAILLTIAGPVRIANAGCGCDKPPPPPAPVRPAATFVGMPVTITSAKLVVGIPYRVVFISGLDSTVRAVVDGVAVARRDLADRVVKSQLVVTLPDMPLGPTKIVVKPVTKGATALLSFSDAALTVAPRPIALPSLAGEWQYPSYQAAVGRDGTMYMSFDLTGLTAPMVFDAWAEGYPLRFTNDTAAFYNVQGFLMQALVKPTTAAPVPGMFVFPSAKPTTESDVLHYSRHEFVTYFLQHFERAPHALDPLDPSWHLDGTPHIDHDHLVVAINGKLTGGDRPLPGATPAHLLRLRSDSLFANGVVGISSVSIRDLSGIDSFSASTGQFGDAGRVYSNGPVEVRDYGMVFGDITGKSITVNAKAIVSGAQQINKQPMTFMDIKVPAGLPQLGAVALASGQARAIVGPGSFQVDSLSLSGNGALSVDNTNGPVTLYVTGSVNISGSATVKLSNPHPEQFAVYVVGAGPVNISGMGSAASAVVYAPNAPVTVSVNAELFGAVVGDTVTTRGSAEIHFHDGLLAAPPLATLEKSLLDTQTSKVISSMFQ